MKSIEALHALEKHKSQTHDILVHLFAQGPLTPMDALVRYGCFRLGARIHELRQMGVPIVTKIIKQGGKRYAQYTLEEENNDNQT